MATKLEKRTNTSLSVVPTLTINLFCVPTSFRHPLSKQQSHIRCKSTNHSSNRAQKDHIKTIPASSKRSAAPVLECVRACTKSAYVEPPSEKNLNNHEPTLPLLIKYHDTGTMKPTQEAQKKKKSDQQPTYQSVNDIEVHEFTCDIKPPAKEVLSVMVAAISLRERNLYVCRRKASGTGSILRTVVHAVNLNSNP